MTLIAVVSSHLDLLPQAKFDHCTKLITLSVSVSMNVNCSAASMTLSTLCCVVVFKTGMLDVWHAHSG